MLTRLVKSQRCRAMHKMNPINLNSLGASKFESAANVYKKQIPVDISTPLTKDTIVETLEGEVNTPTGYRIVTGIKGEQYPIPNDKFQQYIRQPDGRYAKGKVIVKALEIPETGTVTTPWGAELTAKPGDYLIMESPNDMWTIDREIFEATYIVVSEA